MKMPSRRTIGRLPFLLPALLAVGMLAGCSTPDPYQDLPGGGTDAVTGHVVIDDSWVDAPHGLTAGADAPLRLSLTNESATTADALVGVSTPVARSASFVQDGRDVARIALPAGADSDLELTTGVELHGFRRALRPGEWFPVTLTFQNAAPVTFQVAAGQLPAR
ncbi:copper chaperone PCu(A)C [Kribbella sp. CA-253562]|uniref:copper chaperone PCu(A)C n=1 Tax=Kribbella sp. CA-253562 TaxID=3239942 RepID=UPI003D910CF3